MSKKGVPHRSKADKELEISILVNILYTPRTIEDICRKFFGKTVIMHAEKKYVKNKLQIIKRGSHGIIFVKHRYWQIDPKYISGREALIQTILNNYGLIWRESTTNKRRRAECAARGRVIEKALRAA